MEKAKIIELEAEVPAFEENPAESGKKNQIQVLTAHNP
jgi:hypothetical protein